MSKKVYFFFKKDPSFRLFSWRERKKERERVPHDPKGPPECFKYLIFLLQHRNKKNYTKANLNNGRQDLHTFLKKK